MIQAAKYCFGAGALNILLNWRKGLQAVVLALVLTACFEDNQSTDLKLLRVAVLPDESRQQLLARHEPLVKHLAAALGVQYKLIIPDNYDHMNRIIDDDEADLAYFGGVTFVKGA